MTGEEASTNSVAEAAAIDSPRRDARTRSTFSPQASNRYSRLLFHKYTATITGRIFVSFLALLLRHELRCWLEHHGLDAEWAVILRDPGWVREVDVRHDGKHYVLGPPFTERQASFSGRLGSPSSNPHESSPVVPRRLPERWYALGGYTSRVQLWKLGLMVGRSALTRSSSATTRPHQVWRSLVQPWLSRSFAASAEWTSLRSTKYGWRMGEHEKLYEHIMFRRSDSNVSFSALCALLKRLGFDERIKGDHHIFTMSDVEEILNLQPKGGKGKPYQVRQVRSVILEYNLTLEA